MTIQAYPQSIGRFGSKWKSEFPADGMRDSALGELKGRKFDAATETRFSGCRNLKIDDRHRQSVLEVCTLKKEK